MTGATAAWSLSRSPDRRRPLEVPGAAPKRGAEATDASADDLDTALLRAQAGDETGFAELWSALQPPLLRYLRIKAHNVADDVAAETWLHVVRDLAKFTGNSTAFRAWLFTIARNRAIDAARARVARPVIVVSDVHELDRSTAASAETQALERVS